MKSLQLFILEATDDEEFANLVAEDPNDNGQENEEPQDNSDDTDLDPNDEEDYNTLLRDIKFTLWLDFETKVKELKSNTHYQKIEYKYINDEKDVLIDFLLGYKDNSWQLWVGEVGACGYDDIPYQDLEETEFNYALTKSLDIIIDYIKCVLDDKDEYLQYYDN